MATTTEQCGKRSGEEEKVSHLDLELDGGLFGREQWDGLHCWGKRDARERDKQLAATSASLGYDNTLYQTRRYNPCSVQRRSLLEASQLLILYGSLIGYLMQYFSPIPYQGLLDETGTPILAAHPLTESLRCVFRSRHFSLGPDETVVRNR